MYMVYITVTSCLRFLLQHFNGIPFTQCGLHLVLSTHWIQNKLLKVHRKSGHSLHKVCQQTHCPQAKLQILNIHIYGAKVWSGKQEEYAISQQKRCNLRNQECFKRISYFHVSTCCKVGKSIEVGNSIKYAFGSARSCSSPANILLPLPPNILPLLYPNQVPNSGTLEHLQKRKQN